jgi:LysM repeat protein
VPRRVRLWLARLAAPAALLLAATVAVLLIRSALNSDGGASTATTPTVATAPPSASPSPPASTGAAARYYRVRAGDTLETIADQYGTTVDELQTLNPRVDPVQLTIGQRIRVQ